MVEINKNGTVWPYFKVSPNTTPAAHLFRIYEGAAELALLLSHHYHDFPSWSTYSYSELHVFNNSNIWESLVDRGIAVTFLFFLCLYP